MGEAEKALNHCDHTTPYADSVLAFQAHALQNNLKKCIEARKVKDWETVLKEAQSAISLGADSAPQVSFFGPKNFGAIGSISPLFAPNMFVFI